MSQVNVKVPTISNPKDSSNHADSQSRTIAQLPPHHHHSHHRQTQPGVPSTLPHLAPYLNDSAVSQPPPPPPPQDPSFPQQLQQQLQFQAQQQQAQHLQHAQHRIYEQQIQHVPFPYHQDQRMAFPSLLPLPNTTNLPTSNNNNSIATTSQQVVNYPSLYDQQLQAPLSSIPQSLEIKDLNYSSSSARSRSDPLVTNPAFYPPQQQQPLSKSSIEQALAQLSQRDTKILKTLLPMSETHKWKYLSHRVSKIRSKKITSEFVKIKYHSFFGLPYSNHRNSETKYNVEGLLGSSLPYLVADAAHSNYTATNNNDKNGGKS